MFRKCGGKPMSTRPEGPGCYFPKVFVDVTEPQSQSLRMPQKPEEARPGESAQRLLAAKQWASDVDAPEKSWIKSWYFPVQRVDNQRSDLKCWWCTYPFDTPLFPLPWSYNRGEKQWRVYGAFCGPSCAKSYALQRDAARRGIVYDWIDEIAKIYYGYNPQKVPIPFAPKPELLRDYCGPDGLTIEQFRSVCAHGRTLRLHRPGFITIKQVIEGEQHLAKSHRLQGGASHADDPDVIMTTDEMTRTKREMFVGKGVKRLREFLTK